MPNGDFGEKAKGFIKNPIGIIGLFLVLVEAIAAVVVINSTLGDALNLILVLFIAAFPLRAFPTCNMWVCPAAARRRTM